MRSGRTSSPRFPGLRTSAFILPLLFAVSALAGAQPHFDLRHVFPPPGAVRPAGPLVQATDGNFYGTTTAGGTGDNGTIFKMTPAGVVTVMHEFIHASDGSFPTSALIQASDGNLWGTTGDGGFYGAGTIFKMTLAGVFTTVYPFNPNNDGGYPRSPLTQGTDGNFYGLATYQGPNLKGTAFKITPAGTFSVLHPFAGGMTDGAYPQGPLIQATDGNFYGLTSGGGLGDVGTILKMTPAGGVTVIHSFTAQDGASLAGNALVQAPGGTLYGTMPYGGSLFSGIAFSLQTDGTGFGVLHTFGNGTEGVYPTGPLIRGADGNFYGAAAASGNASGRGTVFKMIPAGTVTMVREFTGSDGDYPQGSVTQGSDGKLYGTTQYGGVYGAGAAFAVSTDGSTFTPLVSFTGGTDGARPSAPVTLGTDGNLYGVTEVGGTEDGGTVFRMTPAGAVTILHHFPCCAYPTVGLVQASDGNFYGAAGQELFKITPGGTYTRLHYLDSTTEGYHPMAFIQATDGNFYAAASGGGVPNKGTIFRMTPDGTINVLHTFAGGINDGDQPVASLLQAGDGKLYGTSTAGGLSSEGTAFTITLAGSFALLHSFSMSVEGGRPQAPLIQGNDGNFYGTTSAGTPASSGGVFKMTPAGAVTLVRGFSGSLTEGGNPFSPVVQAPSDLLFGTTAYGGPSGSGSVYQLAPDGTFATLLLFFGTNGQFPTAGLVQLGADNFYGTTKFTGSAANTGGGTIFHLSTFTNNPVVAGVTRIAAVHLLELRSRLSVLRTRLGLAQYAYAHPTLTPGVSAIAAQDVIDVRNALSQVYVALGLASPTYAQPIAPGGAINASQLNEVRTLLTAIE